MATELTTMVLIRLLRSRLVSNVLDHVSRLSHHALIWRNTVVTFVGEQAQDAQVKIEIDEANYAEL